MFGQCVKAVLESTIIYHTNAVCFRIEALIKQQLSEVSSETTQTKLNLEMLKSRADTDIPQISPKDPIDPMCRKRQYALHSLAAKKLPSKVRRHT